MTKKELLSALRELDNSLDGYGLQRKIKLYTIGSTEMILEDLKFSSKDADFIVSRKDYKIILGYTEDITNKKEIIIDLFEDGKLPDYSFPKYKKYCEPSGYEFNNLELYCIKKSVIVLMKVLIGRDKDFDDATLLLDKLKKNKFRLLKEKLEEIYNDFELPKENEKKLYKNFCNFIKYYFKE